MTLLLFSFFVAAAVGSVVASRRLTGDFASPWSMTVVPWSLAAAFVSLHLLPYFPMSPWAITVLSAGVVSIVLGCLAGSRVGRRSTPTLWPVDAAVACLIPFALLGLAGTGWYLWHVHQLFGLGALLTEVARIRTALGTYQIPSLFLFLQYFCIVTVLLAMALALTGTRLGWTRWVLVVACALATWITTDRTQFFMIVLATFFMVAYRRGREMSWAGFVATAVCACGCLVLNFLAVGYWVGKTPENLGWKLTVPATPPGIAAAQVPGRPRPAGAGRRAPSSPPAVQRTEAPATGLLATLSETKPGQLLLRKGSTLYIYGTASFVAFSVWLEDPGPRTHGLQMIYPVARLLDRLGLVTGPIPPGIPPFVPVASRASGDDIHFNGYTFLYYPMQDFGLPGVLAYAGLIGFAAGVLHERIGKRRSSPLHLLMLSQVTMALALSIFVNKFSNTAAWYIFILTTVPFWGAGLVARVRRPVANEVVR
jgi:hypothetical protein